MAIIPRTGKEPWTSDDFGFCSRPEDADEAIHISNEGNDTDWGGDEGLDELTGGHEGWESIFSQIGYSDHCKERFPKSILQFFDGISGHSHIHFWKNIVLPFGFVF